ncbi:aminotransferase class I/II-fold pyridoxal phosphate-dependent enzyme [Alloscardovia theropitheci]|uniref:Aminotransferase class I/II-fold pyridoxal phosphate-dependent enzyme n=1 Tax=Alloscardovia theropitheci TaxID=2496842 RepID=A0A4R0QUI0_9BIFI|nr:aminotransferase class I/II-fold pyridoxal phosphate-dependent enzyme [Alloscardovia theropitheci]TCD55065.1 aminotransferase class I/II-fold pyridoxal phosphate-dependent enzyme [Alloscardovia theropitheci]
MLAFHNDYHAGAHPDVLQALVETNGAALNGYGDDEYTVLAREKIREAIEQPNAGVYLVSGGTQTNQIVIDTMLEAWQGVIAAQTGHVSVHEAGAIEFSGHKVLTVPSYDGLARADDIRNYVSMFYDDPNHDHMVFPGMVYLSYPSEFGTLYSREELIEIRRICEEFSMTLFIDGARLGYALGAQTEHISLPELAQIADVFYTGGTKLGALLGEAIVFTQRLDGKTLEPKHFITQIKQHGALLAQGRVVGVQFNALFTDNLYTKIGTRANMMAQRVVNVMNKHGFESYIVSPTNQQFFVMDKSQYELLTTVATVSLWEPPRNGKYIVRMVTSWDTTDEMVDTLDAQLNN